MKIWKKILAVTLTVAMAALPSTNALAASNTKYLTDIRVGYGDEGKAALQANGYTVWTELDANKGGSGNSVWLGYKTTDNSSEAITDVAVMNMNGGYSFDAYTEKLDELNKNVDTLLAQYSTTITEFRKNYQNGNPYAKTAFEAMNCFYDEDFTNADGSYKGIGDLFVDSSTTTETLHTIFLEANTTALNAIEEALTLGTTETGESNVLTRMEKTEYPDQLDSSQNTARTYIANSFDTFQSEALLAEETYDIVHSAAEEKAKSSSAEGEKLSELEQYLQDNADSLSNTQIEQITTRYNQYELLDETSFGEDEDMTLLDFAKLSKTAAGSDDNEVLTDEYLEMFADALTPGQVGLLPTAGIMTVLTNASVGDSYDETAMSTVSAEAKSVERVSVFCGVDRDLFKNPKGVAMTSDAIRKNASGNSAFGMTKEYITKAAAVSAAAGVSLVGTIVAFASLNKYGTIYSNIVSPASNVVVHDLATGAVKQAASKGMSLKTLLSPKGVAAESAKDIAGYCAIIGMLITLAMLVVTMIEWIDAKTHKEIVYKTIPRAIVELREDGRSFIAYYAARLISASDGETDSLKAYGDLNAQNKQDEWLTLYYTKDPDKGTPITTDMLVRSAADASINTEQYTAIHKFGEVAAADLNQYNTGSGKSSVYVYLRTVTTAAQTGSIFTTGTVLSSVAAFLIGGGIATAVTYVVMRKKKHQTGAVV